MRSPFYVLIAGALALSAAGMNPASGRAARILADPSAPLAAQPANAITTVSNAPRVLIGQGRRAHALFECTGKCKHVVGLFVTQETYGFSGHTAGHLYSSIGLRLEGVSGRFNDAARARRVVVHGAPYVTHSGVLIR